MQGLTRCLPARGFCLTHSAALLLSATLPLLCPGLKAANRVNLVKGSTLGSTLGSVSGSVLSAAASQRSATVPNLNHSPALLQVINFNLLCEESLLRYQQTYCLVSVLVCWAASCCCSTASSCGGADTGWVAAVIICRV